MHGEPPPGHSGGFPLARVGGGGVVNVPAKETEMRGPTLRAAQGVRNEAIQGAIDAVNERSQQTAAQDFAVALQQQKRAQTYEDAANYSAAERADELAQRQADFDQSVKALSQMQKANGNAFANKNAFQQIAMLASLTLGGFVQGWRGGNNPAADAMKQWTDSELKAQELNYQMAKGTAQEKQTAFAMAMQKYGNVDAARSAARAAMMDSFQTELVQQGARWKGTDAANRAAMAAAALQDEKAAQIAAGIQFMPARQAATGPVFVDPETGLTYNEAQAREVAKEFRGHEHDMQKGAQGIAGKLMEKGSEDVDKGATFIAEKLQTAGVPQARAAAERAMASLNKSPGGKVDAAARWAGGPVTPMLAGKDANAREQDYWAFKNAAMKAIAGNVTASEEGRMEKQFGAASDPESRRRAIQASLDMLGDIEKNIKAGASPKAQHTFEQRRSAAEGTPPLLPKGGKAGW
jgi:hypothetical protein